ncbi:MAG: Uma2 family endonuclease [Alphaproteobacteria bacterium]
MSRFSPITMLFPDFLTWNEETGNRHELVRGEVVPIAPATGTHGLLVSRLTIRIGMRLKPPCRVYPEAGLALPDRDTFYVADLVVACEPVEPENGYIAEPLLVVEVLSPATLAYERGIRVPDYIRIPSLQELLLVDGGERGAQLWRREGERWMVETIPGAGSVRLLSTDDVIPLPSIYGSLELD